MQYNRDANFAVFHPDVGTIGFQSESIARDLFNSLDGYAVLYQIEANGNMIQLDQKGGN